MFSASDVGRRKATDPRYDVSPSLTNMSKFISPAPTLPSLNPPLPPPPPRGDGNVRLRHPHLKERQIEIKDIEKRVIIEHVD